MIIIITGASHTGKTYHAKKLLEKYKYNYLSIDLLKMGLIRSGYTKLTPEDDLELTKYLWPIILNIIKTAIENNQDLIIEGGYIPFGWENDLSKLYLDKIRYLCLVMSEEYLINNFNEVKANASIVEKRLDDEWFTLDVAINENKYYLEQCVKHNYKYVLITKEMYNKTLI